MTNEELKQWMLSYYGEKFVEVLYKYVKDLNEVISYVQGDNGAYIDVEKISKVMDVPKAFISFEEYYEKCYLTKFGNGLIAKILKICVANNAGVANNAIDEYCAMMKRRDDFQTICIHSANTHFQDAYTRYSRLSQAYQTPTQAVKPKQEAFVEETTGWEFFSKNIS